jgi:hypothetical protein
MRSRRLLLLLAFSLSQALAVDLAAQAKPRREKFPPRGWKSVEEAREDEGRSGSSGRSGARWSLIREGAWSTGLTLNLKVNQGMVPCDELVVATRDGAVLTRAPAGSPLQLPPLQLGDEFAVYAAQTKKRRYEELMVELVELPGDTFPREGWEPMRPARLKLKGLQQKSWEKDLSTDLAAQLREALKNAGRKPKKEKKKKKGKAEHALKYFHQVSFDARKLREPALYLLCKVRADGSDEIVHQSLSSPLNAGAEAKKGDSFRIYELYPRNKRFRESDVIKLTIGKQ